MHCARTKISRTTFSVLNKSVDIYASSPSVSCRCEIFSGPVLLYSRRLLCRGQMNSWLLWVMLVLDLDKISPYLFSCMKMAFLDLTCFSIAVMTSKIILITAFGLYDRLMAYIYSGDNNRRSRSRFWLNLIQRHSDQFILALPQRFIATIAHTHYRLCKSF